MGSVRRAAIRAVLKHAVIKQGCWVWTGATNPSGYGNMTYRGQARRPHRLMLEAILGRELPRHLFACHHCDNPPCVRPSHLYPGTAKINSADAVARGLVSAGGRHARALRRAWANSSPGRRAAVADRCRDMNRRLTPSDVSEIRRLLRSGLRQEDIAAKFSVTANNISAIKCGTTWRWLPWQA